MFAEFKSTLPQGAVKGYDADKGDLVQTILIVAGFAVATIVAIGMISSTLMNKGESVAGCVAGSSNFTSGAQAKKDCEKVEQEAKKQSHKDIEDNGGKGFAKGVGATG